MAPVSSGSGEMMAAEVGGGGVEGSAIMVVLVSSVGFAVGFGKRWSVGRGEADLVVIVVIVDHN